MKAIIHIELEHRGCDEWGCGHFGAPRGDHIHHGIDYICNPGAHIQSPCDGEVTKIGYPYGDDLSFRYIKVTDAKGLRHRVFYIEPIILLNWRVKKGQALGISQSLQPRYPGITDHIHYEIMDGDDYINPEALS